ncbi:leucine-rich repeat-containing protein 40-like [Teleopsis dalmanni]|uniref:leucine-rich repeat-containing protein 40-like n=1 Tax=Teleopsis dalmanni TaxID=139649 RepID=UPI0018CCA6FE|nr:leucine-rich repeat-containing protein 40-like [Teleopsis dalmanni]
MFKTKKMASGSIGFSPKYSRSTLMSLNPLKLSPRTDRVQTLIHQARQSGVLNLNGCYLQSLPENVYSINQLRIRSGVVRTKAKKNSQRGVPAEVMLQKLDVSSNCVIELSSDIGKLDSLTSLSMQSNALTKLPEEIGQLMNLTRINLSQNKIAVLPLGFYSLINLRYLNISYNLIEELNRGIGNFTALEFFDCANNRLSSLPNSIGYMDRLTKLVLSSNNIGELPKTLVNMVSLQKLDLQHNELISLPKNMNHLRNLHVLSLQDNKIMDLSELAGCDSLLELHADRNKIKRLPNKLVSTWTHLKVLHIPFNRLMEIPSDLIVLQSLTEVDFSFNTITKLSTSVALLQNLIKLYITGNPIRQIDTNINALEPAKVTSTAFKASIIDARIDHWNDSNQFCTTKRSPLCLPNFREHRSEVVNFSNGSLTNLPCEFQFMCICVVDLIGDKTRSRATLPPFLTSFTNLMILNLSNNYLENLPQELAVLKNLTELNISQNKFQYIPNCVYRFKNLTVLLANDNRIKMIDTGDQALGALKHLTTIKMRYNRLTSLPFNLGYFTNIKTLDITGNPLDFPKQRTIKKGTKAIMANLRYRSECAV